MVLVAGIIDFDKRIPALVTHEFFCISILSALYFRAAAPTPVLVDVARRTHYFLFFQEFNFLKFFPPVFNGDFLVCLPL